MEKQEALMIVAVFLAVFVLAFAFSSWLNSQNSNVFGFKIISDKPAKEALQSVLEKNRSLVLRQELTANASRENTAIAAATAEFIYAAAITNATVYNYGVVDGVPLNSSCNANNSFCGEPDITIAIDNSASPCNCIRINGDSTMEIRGSSDFLLQNAANLRKIIYAARGAKD